MNELPYSKESYALLLRAEWIRQVMDREQIARAKWTKTGSREGLAQFRARLIARRATAIKFINYILLVILVIIIWEIIRKLFFPREEESENKNPQRSSEEENKMHRVIKL